MMVLLRQMGGVLNLPLGCEVDTTDLAPYEAGVVERALRDAALVPTDATDRGGPADSPFYELVFETQDGRRSARFDDANKSPSASDLLRVLRPMFRPMAARRR